LVVKQGQAIISVWVTRIQLRGFLEKLFGFCEIPLIHHQPGIMFVQDKLFTAEPPRPQRRLFFLFGGERPPNKKPLPRHAP
jgi:hypothetical protein